MRSATDACGLSMMRRTRWEVVSSDGTKKYRVEISADGREISSNDNASYWQGYLGYPAIAVLMARGKAACERGGDAHARRDSVEGA